VQDAEKARQLRSHLESILNVAQRLRLRCFHRLRPCWTAILSILRECSIVAPHVRTIEVLACNHCFPLPTSFSVKILKRSGPFLTNRNPRQSFRSLTQDISGVSTRPRNGPGIRSKQERLKGGGTWRFPVLAQREVTDSPCSTRAPWKTPPPSHDNRGRGGGSSEDARYLIDQDNQEKVH
jgi:hypothetical protein